MHTITYKNILVSDIITVQNIYMLDQGVHSGAEPYKLQANFGVPLVMAEQDKNSIGFASAAIDAFGSLQINCYFVRNIDPTIIQSTLSQAAVERMASTFENDLDKLKRAIDKLVYWLNSCHY